ncbi:uncharacterized protein LOC110721184 [Chenopodium quinoa]|uniref:uncharacterized protein LOC110719199 n=1 Tax=Chenopodium quinoa TaxID=63459 RepID=UPI000B78D61B|nr:uncharacterized protein LOC110719199 [Chenopodium quinoa]XP_021756017.1 uncharacterized protein LOC110721184 [Chenopodium quinoa]
MGQPNSSPTHLMGNLGFFSKVSVPGQLCGHLAGPVAQPPCPYPSQSWAPRPAASSSGSWPTGPGILGPAPQAYSAMENGRNPSPTHIKAAMQMLANLNLPDNNYYMDTGATSHMTADQDGGQSNEM